MCRFYEWYRFAWIYSKVKQKDFYPCICGSWCTHFTHSYRILDWYDTSPISNAMPCILVLCAILHIFSVIFFFLYSNAWLYFIMLHRLQTANKTHWLTHHPEQKLKQSEQKKIHVNMFHMSTVAAYINQLKIDCCYDMVGWLYMNKRLWLIIYYIECVCIWICRNERHVFNFMHHTNLIQHAHHTCDSNEANGK